MAGPETFTEGLIAELEGVTVEDTRVAGMRIPEIVLYVDINYGGRDWRTNLSYSYVGDAWNDQISSFVVVSGVWEFYRHRDFGDRMGHGTQQFGPGYYRWVEAVGIDNDHISSFKCVAL